jgi:hypothetical protein
MSNSGRIGGKRKSSTKKMTVSKAQVGIDGSTDRTHRRAYAAMARKNKELLVEASILAVRFHDGDKEKAKDWLYLEKDGLSPLERILAGEGKEVIAQLAEMLEGRI